MENVTSQRSAWTKSTPAYDRLSILIHWAIFGLVTTICILGFLFYKLDYRTSSAYASYYYWHRSLGEIVFVLAVLSLMRRLWRKPPPEFEDVNWRVNAAQWTRRILLALLIVVPAIKLWRGAYGTMGWTFFEWHIPGFLPQNVVLGQFLTDAHFYSAIALIALSTLHSLAALWHHYIRNDGLLNRMKPF